MNVVRISISHNYNKFNPNANIIFECDLITFGKIMSAVFFVSSGEVVTL